MNSFVNGYLVYNEKIIGETLNTWDDWPIDEIPEFVIYYKSRPFLFHMLEFQVYLCDSTLWEDIVYIYGVLGR